MNPKENETSPSDPLASDAAEVVRDVQESPVHPPPDPAPEATAAPDAPGTEHDSAGEAFDPSAHLRRKRKDGKWARKPSGRPRAKGPAPGAATQGPFESRVPGREAPPQANTPRMPDPEEDASYRTTAVVTAATITGSLAMIGGADWRASPAELGAMTDAWEAYYRARGIRDMPPEVMLAMTHVAYIGARLGQPAPRAQVAQLLGRARDWWSRRGRPQPIYPEKKNAQSDRRANGVREKHTAEAVGDALPPERDSGPSVYGH